jgi:serine/threonine protein kinase
VSKKFGNWEVQRDLADGGQGITYLVKRTEGDASDQPYVLKRLKNPNRLNRFKREIEAVCRLNHPQVIKSVDHDLNHKTPYIVFEYCDGGTLEEADLKQFDFLGKLRLFQAICEGLAHAHTSAVIHRDLKPANIFLRQGSNVPVVGDFGLCLFPDEEERLTQTSEAVGARWYMAPELEDARYENAQPVADVYSLGKILYWMLAGRIFNREKHRESGWNLMQKDPGSIEIPLVYEFFDQTIVAHPSKRGLKDGSQVLDAVSNLVRRIEMKAHSIGPEITQHCSYCGEGFYKKVLHGKSSNPPQLEDQGYKNMAIKFINVTNHPPVVWLILACDYCGHVQWFRPDCAENPDIWDKPGLA